MLTVGHKLPEFKVPAVKGGPIGAEPFEDVSHEHLLGHWSVLFFWPMDFTFVCPTEIQEFGERTRDFEKLGAKVYGASTDTHFVHLAWREQHPGLKRLPFPMLADHKRELSTALGVLHPADGVPLRATLILDPEGTIRWVSVNDLNVGRNVPETLRVLQALQSDELTPCNWEPGEAFLKAG